VAILPKAVMDGNRDRECRLKKVEQRLRRGIPLLRERKIRALLPVMSALWASPTVKVAQLCPVALWGNARSLLPSAYLILL
jgi:hypothetical protein